MEIQSERMLDKAKEVIRHELDALEKLETYLDESFEKIIDLLYHSKGRIVITGIGKSAIIAQKIAATMNSTGSPALFMHAADAIHGDLGMIQKDDVVIIISKSGESPEVKALVPLIKKFENPIIAMSGNASSFLVKNTDYFINTTIDKEACPHNLAPTTSTTAQLVMGDAIAICLLYKKGFSAQDFAKYHPGGALGKRLYLRVKDILNRDAAPQVLEQDILSKVIFEISSKRLGATAVLNNEKKLLGIITDGDLRRMLMNHKDIYNLSAKDIMTKNPKTINDDAMALEAYQKMSENNITQLPVLDTNQNYLGLIHIHDIIKEGIVL